MSKQPSAPSIVVDLSRHKPERDENSEKEQREAEQLRTKRASSAQNEEQQRRTNQGTDSANLCSEEQSDHHNGSQIARRQYELIVGQEPLDIDLGVITTGKTPSKHELKEDARRRTRALRCSILDSMS